MKPPPEWVDGVLTAGVVPQDVFKRCQLAFKQVDVEGRGVIDVAELPDMFEVSVQDYNPLVHATRAARKKQHQRTPTRAQARAYTHTNTHVRMHKHTSTHRKRNHTQTNTSPFDTHSAHVGGARGAGPGR